MLATARNGMLEVRRKTDKEIQEARIQNYISPSNCDENTNAHASIWYRSDALMRIPIKTRARGKCRRNGRNHHRYECISIFGEMTGIIIAVGTQSPSRILRRIWGATKSRKESAKWRERRLSQKWPPFSTHWYDGRRIPIIFHYRSMNTDDYHPLDNPPLPPLFDPLNAPARIPRSTPHYNRPGNFDRLSDRA